ncbi:MAG: hypothetical protein R2765_12060 [Ferruginibacter sp.]
MVYAFTELMDGNRYAIIWEIIKVVFGIGIIFYLGDWFGATAFLPWINIVLVVYFVLSVIITAWLSLIKEKKQVQVSL